MPHAPRAPGAICAGARNAEVIDDEVTHASEKSVMPLLV
jgi:hypothetical protein